MGQFVKAHANRAEQESVGSDRAPAETTREYGRMGVRTAHRIGVRIRPEP